MHDFKYVTFINTIDSDIGYQTGRKPYGHSLSLPEYSRSGTGNYYGTNYKSVDSVWWRLYRYAWLQTEVERWWCETYGESLDKLEFLREIAGPQPHNAQPIRERPLPRDYAEAARTCLRRALYYSDEDWEEYEDLEDALGELIEDLPRY